MIHLEPKDTTAQPHAANERLLRAVRLTEQLCTLPAVATLDWGDRAAMALSELTTPSLVCVMICEIDAGGTIVGAEAAGVAGRELTGDANNTLLTLRSRAERLNRLAATPHTRTTGERSEGPIHNRLWRETECGALFEGLDAHDLLVSVRPINPARPDRVIVVMIATHGEALRTLSDQDAALLGAVMPMLTRRAAIAIGRQGGPHARWLTSREQQVLELLKMGNSVREIAEAIERSPHTVHDHVKGLHRKLGASSRGELIARAFGYIDQTKKTLGGGVAVEPKSDNGTHHKSASASTPAQHQPHPASESIGAAEPKPDALDTMIGG